MSQYPISIPYWSKTDGIQLMGENGNGTFVYADDVKIADITNKTSSYDIQSLFSGIYDKTKINTFYYWCKPVSNKLYFYKTTNLYTNSQELKSKIESIGGTCTLVTDVVKSEKPNPQIINSYSYNLYYWIDKSKPLIIQNFTYMYCDLNKSNNSDYNSIGTLFAQTSNTVNTMDFKNCIQVAIDVNKESSENNINSNNVRFQCETHSIEAWNKALDSGVICKLVDSNNVNIPSIPSFPQTTDYTKIDKFTEYMTSVIDFNKPILYFKAKWGSNMYHWYYQFDEDVDINNNILVKKDGSLFIRGDYTKKNVDYKYFSGISGASYSYQPHDGNLLSIETNDIRIVNKLKFYFPALEVSFCDYKFENIKYINYGSYDEYHYDYNALELGNYDVSNRVEGNPMINLDNFLYIFQRSRTVKINLLNNTCSYLDAVYSYYDDSENRYFTHKGSIYQLLTESNQTSLSLYKIDKLTCSKRKEYSYSNTNASFYGSVCCSDDLNLYFTDSKNRIIYCMNLDDYTVSEFCECEVANSFTSQYGTYMFNSDDNSKLIVSMISNKTMYTIDKKTKNLSSYKLPQNLDDYSTKGTCYLNGKVYCLGKNSFIKNNVVVDLELLQLNYWGESLISNPGTSTLISGETKDCFYVTDIYGYNSTYKIIQSKDTCVNKLKLEVENQTINRPGIFNFNLSASIGDKTYFQPFDVENSTKMLCVYDSQNKSFDRISIPKLGSWFYNIYLNCNDELYCLNGNTISKINLNDYSYETICEKSDTSYNFSRSSCYSKERNSIIHTKFSTNTVTIFELNLTDKTTNQFDITLNKMTTYNLDPYIYCVKGILYIMTTFQSSNNFYRKIISINIDDKTNSIINIPDTIGVYNYNTSCCSDGKFIYILGGARSSNRIYADITNKFYKFDTEEKTFSVIGTSNFDYTGLGGNENIPTLLGGMIQGMCSVNSKGDIVILEPSLTNYATFNSAYILYGVFKINVYEKESTDDGYESNDRYIKPKIVVHFDSGSEIFESEDIIDYFIDNPKYNSKNPCVRINTSILSFTLEDMEKKLLPINNIDKFKTNIKCDVYSQIYSYSKDSFEDTLIDSYYINSYQYNNDNSLTITAYDKLYNISLLDNPLSKIYYNKSPYYLLTSLFETLGLSVITDYNIDASLSSINCNTIYSRGEKIIDVLLNLSNCFGLEIYSRNDCIYVNHIINSEYEFVAKEVLTLTDSTNLSNMDINRNINPLFKKITLNYEVSKNSDYSESEPLIDTLVTSDNTVDKWFELRFDHPVSYVTSISTDSNNYNIIDVDCYQNGVRFRFDNINRTNIVVKGVKMKTAKLTKTRDNPISTGTNELVIDSYLELPVQFINQTFDTILKYTNNPNDTIESEILFNPKVKIGSVIKLVYLSESVDNKLYRVIGVNTSYSSGFSMKVWLKEVYNV